MTRRMKARRQTALMRSALGLARVELLAERRLIVECNSVRGVVERAAWRHVARLDQLLASIDRALGQAARGVCRVCRCVDERACEGGCAWVEPDLCSACRVVPEPLPSRAGRRRRDALPPAIAADGAP